MGRGAVEFVVLEFPGDKVDPQLPAAMRHLVDKGIVSVIDLLFVSKDAEGRVRTFELDEVGRDPDYGGFDEIAQAIDGLISPEDVADLASELSPGSMALVVLFEHAWMRDLQGAVARSGGRVVFTERIPAEVVEAVAEAGAATV
jgi:uncharacterized membrane protein